MGVKKDNTYYRLQQTMKFIHVTMFFCLLAGRNIIYRNITYR